jgi:uncharacterized protein
VDLNLDDFEVIHNEEARRFELRINDALALLAYRRFPGRILYHHTEVPPEIERRGVAAKLARAAMDFARANNLQVVPACSYVAAFVAKHQEYQDLVSPEDLRRLTT